ncbi:MAG TPA: general secretion pathway protein GspB [Steroidobacteraceae bacterium]|nr:general secretion pathway protein GspB [Steroidobacteraceae bacterium]
MSFILDALKKSETERQRADAPALYEMKMAPPRRGIATWLIVLAGLLVINVVVLSVVLLRGAHSVPPTEATAVSTPAAAPPSPAVVAVTVANPAPAPATAPPEAAAPAAVAPDIAPAGTVVRQADDDAPAVESARTSAARTSAASTDLPTYEQASSAPGANLPELRLDLHAYASNPANRFVFLNMVKLKEGQSSPAGVRVESITPDGAILSWQGSRFFLQRQ